MTEPAAGPQVPDLMQHLTDCVEAAKAARVEARAGMSTNDRAEALFGRRGPGIPFDMPCERGYRCPVCVVEDVGREDEGIQWSEYNGFPWCERCNRDYPSALCVPLVGRPAEEPKWRHAIGPDAAVSVFLDTVEQALSHKETPDA